MGNKKLVNSLLNYGIVAVLLVLIIIFSLSSKNFLRVGTIFTILTQVSTVGIISVGMTFVMITGGIDLSVGSIAGLSSVTAASLMLIGLSPFAACVGAVFMAAVFGALNGLFINAFRVPPLIATLGMMTSLRGAAYLVTGGLPVFGFGESFKAFAQASLWIIPYPVLLMLLVFAMGYFVLNKMRAGRYIYGVGSNAEASRLSGINVSRIRYTAYMMSGFLSGIAGLVLLSRTSSGQPAAGAGYEMDAITAVVLGGVSITGGEGNVLLVIVGVIIMGVLTTGMIMTNINDYIQQVIKGMVLVFAVAFAQFSQKMRAKNIEVE